MSHRILSRKAVFKTRAFDIEQLHVLLPDGRERDYDLVSHNDSVTILPLDGEGNIWFVTQFRMGSAGPLLELPAGVMNDGEDPQACAAREIREETGLSAGALTALGFVYLAPGYSSEKNHIFLAEDLSAAPLDMDEDEFLEVSAIPAEEACQLALSGKIQDAKSLAALLLAYNRISS